MFDALGTTISIGDTVAYPVRRGSITELRTGYVVCMPANGGLGVSRTWDGRCWTVTRTDRVVVCRRPYIPTPWA